MNTLWRYLALTLLLSGIGFPGFVAAQDVSLAVKPHAQEHSLSCEIATLKMALSVHGIEVSETELIARMPFDRTPKGDGVWGDPQAGFVGTIDGRMLVDGYGVYSKPIAKVGSAYAHTEVLEHGSPQQLARAINEGNPVIIWGYYGTQRNVASWRTSQGISVKAVHGEHTRLVYGFDGPPDAPTRFYLLDPSRGSFFSWSTEELMHNWSSLNHMAVIVSPRAEWLRAAGETQIWEINPQQQTRHWITSWETFIKRGGSSAAVSTVAKEKLLRYTPGSSIK